MIATSYTIDNREIFHARHVSLREAIASMRRLRQAAIESWPGDGMRRTVVLTIEIPDGRLGHGMEMDGVDIETNGNARHNCVGCGACLYEG
jgi:hypothetical protein